MRARAPCYSNLAIIIESAVCKRCCLRQLLIHELSPGSFIPVLTYGLRTDFRGELFPGSQYLLAWADELIEIKTICHCGRKAIMNCRINANGDAITEGEQVFIGGNESYISLCRRHFYQRQTRPFTLEQKKIKDYGNA